VAYCEIDSYCQKVLLARIAEGQLPDAPIWDNICTLTKEKLLEIFKHELHIIYAGFPCQDISCAGTGKGLEGKRSGLFWEINRLVNEIRPKFIFLENVPAITTRGGLEVVKKITYLGYDCRWITLSAHTVGALHKRNRWFLLACNKNFSDSNGKSGEQTNTQTKPEQTEKNTWRGFTGQYWPFISRKHWQKTVSEMVMCTDGISDHMDRCIALGNSVVPQQAKKAFKILMGLECLT
jgi:DNA (cytosine-5)-methyltransferase 1